LLWICKQCGFRESVRKYYWRCPKCGAPLDVEYEGSWNPRGKGLARYASSLPVSPTKTLGEGLTPIVKMKINKIKIWFKLEYLNPTGSFKDRGASLSLYFAKKLGYKTAVEDTSGNTGIAVTAYANLYDLKSIIYMPKQAPKGKKNLVKILGGEVIEAPSRAEASKMVLEKIKEPGVFYVAHIWSPLFIEGNKTIAYEAFEQGFKHGVLAVPIGSGGLLLGVYRGYKDLFNWGLVKEIPFILGIQGCSVQPVYTAIYGKPLECGESTLADGIMVSNPPRVKEVVDVIKRYGNIVLVNNDEIIKALKILYKHGLIVEPTSAAVLAGILKALDYGIIDPGDNVLALLTGSGLKTHDILDKFLNSR